MALGKFNAKEAEARIYADWEAAGCFKAGANARTDAATYCVMIPPPNVTGVLHMGHAFNNTLQDILTRWHRMRGFDTLWQPGTDHAGIATQMVVERRLAETQQPSRTELGREAFTQKIWEWKAESGGTIRDQLKRLGASCDWSREAFTMSGAPGAPEGEEGNFHDAVIKVFVEMFNQGLIYRGKRLVNWDPHFETAISDLEVENIEVPGHMWHFKYPLAGGETYTYVEKDEDGNVTLEEERDYISIATTRPETMLGDGAVAVNPSDERYTALWENGKRTLCEIPVGPKEHRRLIPIITDEYPDPTFGSGAVKITGAHDFNDYQVAKRGGIPMYNLMDSKANMRADGKPYAEEAAAAQAIANGDVSLPDESVIAAMNLVPDDYRGMSRENARKVVVADITAEGNAVMETVTAKDEDGNDVTETRPYVENKPIMQPFGDRSRVVIEPLLTDQWFVDSAKIVGPALDAVKNGDVKILPESGEKVYFHWLENIEPWCISRQLWWGHQIPVWYGPERNDNGPHDYKSPVAFCGATFQQAAQQAAEYYAGSEQGYEHTFVELKRDEYKADWEARRENKGWPVTPFPENMALDDLAIEFAEDLVDQNRFPKEEAVVLYRDPDVLDTWFSSGLWPIGTLGWPEDTPELQKYLPTSDLITGQDILFFWVARMMMMQLAITDKIPFDTVYLHGLVRDAKGKKMSKSTGNVMDPLDLIEEYGADALRFSSAAMASLGGTLKLDTQRIAGYRNFGTKLWNAASYGEMRGIFDLPHSAEVPDTKHPLNRWIKGELSKTRETVDQALTDYRFNDAASALYAFTWNTFCDWYLEFTKPIFDEGTAEEIEETKATYAWALDQCLILLHPIMPFITEELWQQKQRSKRLIHADWPTYTTDLVDAEADAELNWVIRLIEAIRSARAQMHVPAGAYVPCVVKGFEPRAKAAYERNKALIHRFARLESLTDVDDFPKGTVALAVSGGTFGLPLADVIDVGEEIARLEKTLGKLAKELGGLRGRLKNPKFAESAPAEVVEETKANLRLREEEESKLQEALTRLKEL